MPGEPSQSSCCVRREGRTESRGPCPEPQPCPSSPRSHSGLSWQLLVPSPPPPGGVSNTGHTFLGQTQVFLFCHHLGGLLAPHQQHLIQLCVMAFLLLPRRVPAPSFPAASSWLGASAGIWSSFLGRIPELTAEQQPASSPFHFCSVFSCW